MVALATFGGCPVADFVPIPPATPARSTSREPAVVTVGGLG